MSEFKYDVIVLAVSTEFFNHGARHGAKPTQSTFLFFWRLGAKIGIMYAVLMQIQEKDNEEQCTIWQT